MTKGDALYNLGEFEHALVCYHRALRRKRWQLSGAPFQVHGHTTGLGGCTTKEEELVRIGIGRAVEAVDNALGGVKADEHFDSLKTYVHRIPEAVFDMTWRELNEAGPDFFNVKPRKESYGSRRASLCPTVENKERRYQRELLGQLAKDLDYLETLALRGDFEDSQTRSVKKEAKEAVDFLKHRQEFWSQFRPMYSGDNKK